MLKTSFLGKAHKENQNNEEDFTISALPVITRTVKQD
jgi:hypothetical protein